MQELKDIVDSIKTRVNAPYFGYMFCTFVILNWKAIFFLAYAKTNVPERISYFETHTTIWTCFLGPLLIGVTLALVSPWLRLWFSKVIDKPTIDRNILNVKSEYELVKERNRLAKEKEYEEERLKYNELLEQVELANSRAEKAEIKTNKEAGEKIELMSTVRSLEMKNAEIAKKLHDKVDQEQTLIAQFDNMRTEKEMKFANYEQEIKNLRIQFNDQNSELILTNNKLEFYQNLEAKMTQDINQKNLDIEHLKEQLIALNEKIKKLQNLKRRVQVAENNATLDRQKYSEVIVENEQLIKMLKQVSSEQTTI